jgi:3'-phosphoadenosine 5'-phosphosulfate sulfotransferase (PAPS reductase)/FAD synthetase
MTRDPFKIEGPALVSFSGGRTSAYMLRRILDSHGGTLPDDVHVVFANTGKERVETLDFVHACETRWGVPVTWVEMPWREPDKRGFAVTDFASAARNGEPFLAFMVRDKTVPSPFQRSCTGRLKIKPMHAFMRSCGHSEWTNVIGIRADEPLRVARLRGKDDEDNALPLASAGVTQEEVRRFWAAQDFDLGLRSWEGNCDLCFLKGYGKLKRIALERPDLVQWWADAEEKMRGITSHPHFATFRRDQPPYRNLLNVINEPALPGIFDENHGAIIDCMCTEGQDE